MQMNVASVRPGESLNVVCRTEFWAMAAATPIRSPTDRAGSQLWLRPGSDHITGRH